MVNSSPTQGWACGAIGVALLGALLNQAYQSVLPASAPASVRASIVGALADRAWAAAGRTAFAHGAAVALGAGAALIATIGIAAAILHRRSSRPPDQEAGRT